MDIVLGCKAGHPGSSSGLGHVPIQVQRGFAALGLSAVNAEMAQVWRCRLRQVLPCDSGVIRRLAGHL